MLRLTGHSLFIKQKKGHPDVSTYETSGCPFYSWLRGRTTLTSGARRTTVTASTTGGSDRVITGLAGSAGRRGGRNSGVVVPHSTYTASRSGSACATVTTNRTAGAAAAALTADGTITTVAPGLPLTANTALTTDTSLTTDATIATGTVHGIAAVTTSTSGPASAAVTAVAYIVGTGVIYAPVSAFTAGASLATSPTYTARPIDGIAAVTPNTTGPTIAPGTSVLSAIVTANGTIAAVAADASDAASTTITVDVVTALAACTADTAVTPLS
ncbi:hypothetical protein MBOU_43550 [Mycobacterium bourgelatii]|uniref:Uncharacterized protein n=1 Tax=Mycobacterium bourgelatii TaxID=1273442 RepID=A0A7I9YUS0_MYCBU|nr:hypothetical protein MBOU_43550 [Mycobacterium bourgelatii]